MAIHEAHSRRLMDTELTREQEQEAARAAVLVVHVRALEDQHERITRAAEQFLSLAGEIGVPPETLEHRASFDHAAHRQHPASRHRSRPPAERTARALMGWTVRRPVYVTHEDHAQWPQAGVWVLVDGRVIVGMTPTPKSALSRTTG